MHCSEFTFAFHKSHSRRASSSSRWQWPKYHLKAAAFPGRCGLTLESHPTGDEGTEPRVSSPGPWQWSQGLVQHPACFSMLMSGCLGVGGREVLGWKLPPRPLPPFSAVLTHPLCSKPCICQECVGGCGSVGLSVPCCPSRTWSWCSPRCVLGRGHPIPYGGKEGPPYEAKVGDVEGRGRWGGRVGAQRSLWGALGSQRWRPGMQQVARGVGGCLREMLRGSLCLPVGVALGGPRSE